MAYDEEDIIVVRCLALFAAALTWQGSEPPSGYKRSEAVVATADKYVHWLVRDVADGR